MNKILIYTFALQLAITFPNPFPIFGHEFTEEEKNWIKKTGPLRFSEVEWEPLSYTSDDPDYKGIIADYLQILSEKTGIKLVYVQSSTWQEVLDKFAAREIDIIPALARGDKIGSEVILTKPYISFPLVIATKPNIDFISNTSELEGKLVGVGKGYTSQNFLKNNYPQIELVTTDNVLEGLTLLSKGKIDAFVGHMAVITDVIKKNRMDLRIAGKTEYIFEHRMGLHPEQKQTVDIFNKVLSRITPEEHNSIYNRWIKMNTEVIDYSLVWKVLISTFIIFSGIVYWNRKLSADKNKFRQLYSDLNSLKNELEMKNRELNKLAITDQLTGLYNRLKLDGALQNEAARFSRSKKPFGIILMDIDHFKAVNDNYGHLAGDIILVSMAGILIENTRNTDIIGRWGGEEFLIICPDTDEEGVNELAEKLRNTIEIHTFPEIITCTASFGATIYHDNDDITKLLKRTDEALYAAKKSGRNKVVLK